MKKTHITFLSPPVSLFLPCCFSRVRFLLVVFLLCLFHFILPLSLVPSLSPPLSLLFLSPFHSLPPSTHSPLFSLTLCIHHSLLLLLLLSHVLPPLSLTVSLCTSLSQSLPLPLSPPPSSSLHLSFFLPPSVSLTSLLLSSYTSLSLPLSLSLQPCYLSLSLMLSISPYRSLSFHPSH